MAALPDNSYLYVGGSKRLFPVKDAAGKLSLPALAAAMKAIPSAPIPTAAKVACIAKAKTMMAEAKAEAAKGGMTEVAREFSEPLQESSLQGFAPVSDDGVMRDCLIIREGLNAISSKLYTAEFLKASVGRFEHGHCNLDHPTMTEMRDRPEGRLTDLAGYMTNARWSETERGIVADVKLLADQPTGERVQKLFADDVVRETAGLSIYWPHGFDAVERQIDGRRVQVPIALKGPAKARMRADFVTMPTAGGRVGPARR